MENHVKNVGLKELADFKVHMMTSGYADRSIESYINYMHEFLRYIEEKSIEKLSEVTPEVVSRYQLYVATQTYRGRTITLKTQNLKLIPVIMLFRYLVREKHFLYDPTSHIRVKDPKRKRTRDVLTEKEMVRILNAPNPETPLGLRDKALLELYYSCGIRNTESRLLTIKDVDLENRLVRIRYAKGGGDRVVPITKVAAVYLEEYLRYARPKLVRNELEETFFLSKRGLPLTDDMPAWIVQKYAKIAKVQRKTDAHTLRHSCGTHLYDNGADVRCIQELLGHKSLDTTMIYVQIRATKLRKVLQKTHPREKGIVYAPEIE